ncbi:sugar ABC transporter ATP-binding protein [Devosia sp. 66-22]|uniref:sugar ABC transporter ATP-binding protein n=1 Tax=Devosia sp. 66-22 TaxID=1895753 RepID=UPI000A55978C|nr:sugar ABC transporter ATP-binding protein [Devosia sp. 66-22]
MESGRQAVQEGADTVVLSMGGISKRYPGVVALDDVALTLRRGEVHGLVSENGAGKSTLIKILAGAIHADSGEIVIAGRAVDHPTPAEMHDYGIAVIYQELMLAPHLTVAENLFLGRLPRGPLGIIDWRAAHRQAGELMDRLGFRVDPAARLDQLSVAQRQMVEIASALSRNARIVVLDEPSAVLGGSELERLFEIIRRLSAQGVSFIYISHRLSEVFAICDNVTVLRDGRRVGSRPIGEVDPESLISMMVGRTLADIYPARRRGIGAPVLSVRGLNRPRVLHGIDLDVRAGEILGICGLAGSGRTELLRALMGADRAAASTYTLRGRERRIATPAAAIRERMCLLPEDRKTQGCFLPQSVAFNMTIARLGKISRGGMLSHATERRIATRLVQRLKVRTPGPDALVHQLSGGNQQKCLIARSLNAECDILLIDEPTRGVDVGAKREIYELLAQLADEEHAAIVMVSSELPEILGLSDRILVMRDGRIAGRFERDEATEEKLMAAAIGAGRPAREEAVHAAL